MTHDDPTPSDPASTTNGPPLSTDAPEVFAADLRQLRLAAGSPTLAALEQSTGVSKTVLSEAFSGRRLPSARTVAAIVRVFDGDVRAWARRRDALEAGPRVAESPVAPEVRTPARVRAVVRRRTTVLLSVAAFALGAVSAMIGVSVIGHAEGGEAVAAGTADARAAVATGPAIIVPDGVDPADTACVEDAEVVASEDRTHHTQLQIVYSASCHAAWSRITRYDAASHGNTITTSIYRQIAPNAKDRQTTTEPDAESAYTPLLVRPTPSTRLCAVGSITVDGKSVRLGDPLCL